MNKSTPEIRLICHRPGNSYYRVVRSYSGTHLAHKEVPAVESARRSGRTVVDRRKSAIAGAEFGYRSGFGSFLAWLLSEYAQLGLDNGEKKELE
jgi:hypothetical protein